MRNTFLLLALILTSTLKSQSIIIEIPKSGFGQPDGYYRKDIKNLLDPFQGTYLYTSGNTSFKIVLKKMIKQPVFSHYEDIIIGEYQYIKNGQEKVNTLSNLDIAYSDQFLKHNIAGNGIISKTIGRIWNCPECNPNEKRLSVRIEDASTNRYARMLMRRTVVNGQQVLQVNIANINTISYNVDTESPPADFSLPTGEFTMTKQ